MGVVSLSIRLATIASCIAAVAASSARPAPRLQLRTVASRIGVGPVGCATANGFAQEFRAYALDVITSTDSMSTAEREDWQLPAVDTSGVMFVTDSVTCDRAAVAHALRVGADTANRPRVFVLGVGPTRYIVFNGDRVGESFLYYVYDSAFTYLTMIGS